MKSRACWLFVTILLVVLVMFSAFLSAVRAGDGDWWPMFHHDANHSGTSNSTGPIINSTLWTFTTGNSVYSSPAVVEGFVYIGSYDRKMYCLNASTGEFVWSYSTNNAVYGSPAVVDDRVYVGDGEWGTYGWIYCLNASTGALIWYVQTASVDARLGGVYSSPAVADGRLFVGCNNGHLYCLNATNGENLWNVGQITGGSIVPTPTVFAGLVYAGASDGWVYCRNAIDGSQVWSYKTSDGLYSSCAVLDGRLFVGSNDGKVYCLNSTTGASLWNFTTGSYVDSSPAVKGNLVYVGSHDGKIYCLNATSGTLVWNYTTGGSVWASSPAVGGGLIYVGSNDTKLYCLDSTSGSLVWSYQTLGSVVSSPSLANGAVYFGSLDSRVYALWQVPPLSISVVTPENATYTSNIGISFAYAVDGVTSWVGYSLDGQPNVTVIGNTTFPTLSEGGHRLIAYANDTSGRTGASAPVSFTVDLPPTGTITINNGEAYTNSTRVTLTLTYSDTGSGVGQVRYGNDGGSWGPWEAASNTKAWTLNSAEGAKTVNYQVKDSAGTISQTYSDTIILDTSTPRGNILINNGAAYSNTTAVNLNLLAQDDISGVSVMRFTNDWTTWTTWEPYATLKPWTLQTGEGEKTVAVQYLDRVNLTVAAYDTIILDLTRPTANAGKNQTVEVYTTVTFNGTASTDNTGISSYLWDFGDGSTGKGVTPTHAYTNVGNYVVTLMVEDLAGNKATSTSSVTIVVFIPELPGGLLLLIAFAVLSLAGLRKTITRFEICETENDK